MLTAGLGTVALQAQSYLVIEDKGQVKVVRKISNLDMYVEDNGQLKSKRAIRSGLTPAPEFLPVFVAVRDIEVHTSALNFNGGSTINNEFHFRAAFESPYLLEDVFFVLDLEMSRGGKRIYSQGIGRLEPRKPRTIIAGVPLQEELGEGKYELHVFSQGLEVFHSGQPWQFREHVLDQMVTKRIAGLQEALPSPLIGPAPEYPKQLIKAKVKGEVVLRIRITRTGVVADPVVEKATDPAFGEAALVAVRQWRFLPRIKDGLPVETVASLPFAFEPHVEAGKN